MGEVINIDTVNITQMLSTKLVDRVSNEFATDLTIDKEYFVEQMGEYTTKITAFPHAFDAQEISETVNEILKSSIYLR